MFVNTNLGTGMAESPILTQVDVELSCWDGILRYIQPYCQVLALY